MEDEELENIKKKQLEDLLKQQNINNILNETPVMELTSQNFNQEISNNDLLLVDFWAEWCGPCKSMHPIFTRMAKKYKQVRFARVNVDNAQDIAMKYGVQSIPTFIMFKNGEIANQMVGAVGEPGIHMICKKFTENQ
ncbi:MAG: Thioredoxin 1 [Candidatus Nitrosopelagicus brevis]|jgi:thioredoxin 1|nr:thioredoxin [Candidatus Nitrosopelagicus brevis]MEC7707799.1 thioredoxin [Thermoproteota archaeon]GIT55566.1 MAG: thiol reductase thioredoxin [Candidatus Nitrosopelagicus sp.]MEC9087513.1 thioredoxin [Thermoproteota archaeon]MEC9436470.1 thioredoxin [Thermoproteota archaeon]|tara:strand:+ start:4051 stop:4461 length:411 start_codon:yes stop_codon:yes gene_type:complete